MSDEQRKTGASGGLASWCIEELLRRDWVDKVAVVMRNPENVRLFTFVEVTEPRLVRKASGSVYYPVSIEAILTKASQEPQVRWGIIGIPCMIAAVRTAMMRFPSAYGGIRFLLGLVCGMLQNDFYTEALVAKSGIKLNDVGELHYRVKNGQTKADNYLFRAWDSTGRPGKPIPYQSLPFYLGRRGFFRYNACNYCEDVFAEAADICFMDAWLPRYSEDPLGTSTVVIRNQELEQTFLDGSESGAILADSMPASDVEISQRGQIHRKRVTIALRCQRDKSRLSESKAFGIVEYLDWCLQRYTQHRSKAAWKRWGRTWGLSAFWLALSDVTLSWWLFDHVLPMLSKGRHSLSRAVGMLRRFSQTG